MDYGISSKLKNCLNMADFYQPLAIMFSGEITMEETLYLTAQGYEISKDGVSCFSIKKNGYQHSF